MSHSAIEYQRLLKSLMPKGKAWSNDPDSVQNQLLYGLAEELARIDARADDLVLESNPATAVELLEEHEADYGIDNSDWTTEERQSYLAS